MTLGHQTLEPRECQPASATAMLFEPLGIDPGIRYCSAATHPVISTTSYRPACISTGLHIVEDL